MDHGTNSPTCWPFFLIQIQTQTSNIIVYSKAYSEIITVKFVLVSFFKCNEKLRKDSIVKTSQNKNKNK